MGRQLASIQRLHSLEPIEGADRIQRGMVLGWHVIVPIHYEEGMKGVFFEIDSVLPEREWSAFLNGKQRIRTVKMKGVLSQGLFLDAYSVPTQLADETCAVYVEGTDVTELLGVTLYEPPQETYNSKGSVRPDNLRPFFYNVPRTDQPRLQSNPALVEEVLGQKWEATLKMDGQSVTCIYDRDTKEVRTASRNYEVVGDWKFREAIVEPKELTRKLAQLPTYAFQGEFCGKGIQKDRIGLGENYKWYVFDIFDTATGKYKSGYEIAMICMTMGLDFAPLVLNHYDCSPASVDDWVELAKLTTYRNGHPAEGIVVRIANQPHFYSKTLRDRLSFKVISPNYLLKIGE